MLIVIKNTKFGNMPIIIPDDVSFWFGGDLTRKILKITIYYPGNITKELSYVFESLEDLKKATNYVSKQVLEIQRRTNNKTFFEDRKEI